MSFGEDMVAVCVPTASSWRERLARLRLSRSAHAKILGGSLIMLFGSIFVSLANFGYNIGVARLRGTRGFQSRCRGRHHPHADIGYHPGLSTGLRQAGGEERIG